MKAADAASQRLALKLVGPFFIIVGLCFVGVAVSCLVDGKISQRGKGATDQTNVNQSSLLTRRDQLKEFLHAVGGILFTGMIVASVGTFICLFVYPGRKTPVP